MATLKIATAEQEPEADVPGDPPAHVAPPPSQADPHDRRATTSEVLIGAP
jgi:hypothetical protein